MSNIREYGLGLRLWAYRHLARWRAKRTIRRLRQRPAPPPAIEYNEYWMPPYFAAHGTPVERGGRVLGRRPTDADWDLLNGKPPETQG